MEDTKRMMQVMNARGMARLAESARVKSIGWYTRARCCLAAKARDCKGQGTTEYAILVGVLVVIAMLAITVFKPKIQSLWDAIASGINGL